MVKYARRVALSGARMSVALLTGTLVCAAQAAPVTSATAAAAAKSQSEVLHQYDQAVSALAERALPAIVQIDTSGFGKPESTGSADDTSANSDLFQRQRAIGSGVIVDPDGYIMTNAHVVAGAERIRVTITPPMMSMVSNQSSFLLKQRVYEAKLIGSNQTLDLALLKIEEKNLPTIPLQTDFAVHLGQSVLAIGSPEGLEHTITRGIVSSVGRQVDPDRAMVYIQTDAPINPGNSGGALIDMEGNLLGLNTFILSEGGGSEGLGFAIPEPVVRYAYDEFRKYGRLRRSVIGANAQSITADLAAALHLGRDWGVVIADVTPDGPAAKGGLKQQDVVLTIDNRVIDSYPKFAAAIYLHEKGTPLNMEVLRQQERVKLRMVPAEAPQTIDNLEDLIDPQKSLVVPLGVFLLELTPALVESVGELRSEQGLMVVARSDYSPRLDADLHARDVIRSINGKPVKTIEALRSALSALPPRTPVALEIERGQAFQYIAFEME